MSEFEKDFENMINAYDCDYVGYVYLKDIFISKYAPKQLVEIPQFVADYIELCKGLDESLSSIINMCERVWENNIDDAHTWIHKNGDTFIKAWIYGYTVKERQLYIIEYPMTIYPYVSAIGKNEDNEIIISGYTSEKNKAKMFTEQEIKEIDERLMVFTVKVEE